MALQNVEAGQPKVPANLDEALKAFKEAADSYTSAQHQERRARDELDRAEEHLKKATSAKRKARVTLLEFAGDEGDSD